MSFFETISGIFTRATAQVVASVGEAVDRNLDLLAQSYFVASGAERVRGARLRDLRLLANQGADRKPGQDREDGRHDHGDHDMLVLPHGPGPAGDLRSAGPCCTPP